MNDLATMSPTELLLWRRAARKSFAVFCEFMMADSYIPGAHLDIIHREIQAVEDGHTNRLIITMPPRHGKSVHISQLYPAWCLGKNPKTEIVNAGYGADIALEQSRRARDLFLSPRFSALFPEVRLAKTHSTKESQAAHEWGTPQRGRYLAVGIGGGLTGKGADRAIIDDPVKDREEAESQRYRDRAWDWYTSVLSTRLSPGAPIIVIQTRWHPDDLAGRLLNAAEDGTGEAYRHVNLPAIDPEGCYLWPQRFSGDEYEGMKLRAGSRDWEALYQGNPTIRGGNFFNMDNLKFHPIDDFPEAHFIRCWDVASTEKQTNKGDPDFTAGALCAVTHERGLHGLIPHFWIKDITYGQWAPNVRNGHILATAQKDGPTVPIYYEAVGGYKDSAATIKDELRGLRSFTPHVVSSDKMVRAEPLQPLFEAGNIHVPTNASWLSYFTTQATEFPNSAHDDLVDAVATAFNKVGYTKRAGVLDLSMVGR